MSDTLSKETNVGYKLRLLHNQLHNHIEHQKEQNEYMIGDLTRMQRFTIGFLYHHSDKDVYQKDLETEFAISRATASNMLTVMERKGLIKREPVAHDARLKKLVLTEQAMQMHRQIQQDIMETERLLTKGLDEDDKRQLHRYIDIMIQNLVGDTGDNTTTCCGNAPK
ncbi:MAG: MarR family transcriptional regulator [Lachnospiraceae bacterium]|nr:MarR family transcriptional regulator [Lachnospiraceae bacterium]